MAQKRTLSMAALLLIAVLIFGACSGGAGDSASSGGGVTSGDGGGDAAYDEIGAPETMEDTDAGASTGGGDDGFQSAPATDLPDVGPNVIKTATLGIEVKGSFSDSMQDVIDAATRHGGFVTSSSIAGDDARSGSIVIRVPSEQFEATLGEIKGIASKVTREEVAGQDVSQEFVDLTSRVRNLEAQENVLLGLMNDATTVAASIRVQRELSGVQMEIERLRGRINYLKDQTDYSTISLRMREPGAVAAKPAPPEGAFERAWDNATKTLAFIYTGVVVGAGFVLPLALIALMLLFAFKAVRPLVVKTR